MKLKLKPNYFTIPLITIMVAWLGGNFTTAGIESGWYENLAKPAWTPSGSFIGGVWTVIFILATISAIIVWNQLKDSKNFSKIITLFLVNAFLNFSWSFLFFGSGLIATSAIWAGMIAVSVGLLIYYIWPESKIASWLLAPYLGWVCFATYLNFIIWQLN
jgi:tryptophan-rich sensory protein